MKVRWLPLPGILVGCALAAGLLFSPPEPAFAAIIEVDRLDDANVSTCSAAANDCTLRGAITKANTTVAADEIGLVNLGAPGVPATINIGSALPDIVFPLTMNGLASQGGFVRLNYTGAAPAVDGLRINADSTHIFGMVITSFSGDGVKVFGQITDVSLVANRIGVNHTGTTAAGNARFGVHVVDGPDDVRVEINIIAANGMSGVNFAGNVGQGNAVTGNFIGTNAAGADLGNTGAGVIMNGAGNNIIGGAAAEDRNVISGNTGAGIILGSPSNFVRGNYVGTNLTGTAAVANGGTGIRVDSADNTIGGLLAGEQNLVSGNGTDGILINGNENSVAGNRIGTNAAGTGAIANQGDGIDVFAGQGNGIGGNIQGSSNVLSGNRDSGIYLRPASGNSLIVGNLIGTNVTGTGAVANGGSGIWVDGSSDNRIGLLPGGNLISGNAGDGVQVNNGAANNFITNNRIGTNVSATAAIPNISGVRIFGGATTANTLDSNVISGNASSGVVISDSPGNILWRNFIGTNGSSADLGNASEGVYVDGAANNTIGQPELGNRIQFNSTGIRIRGAGATDNSVEGNLISQNNSSGILLAAPENTIGGTEGVDSGLCRGACNRINNNGTNGITVTTNPFGAEPSALAVPLGGPPLPANNNQILGNHIGIDGMASFPAPNGEDGILIDGAAGTRIGGSQANSGNVISGNDRFGIFVIGEGASGTSIIRNLIGTNSGGNSAVSNRVGIGILNGASNTRVGGTGDGEGNLISGNESDGIILSGGAFDSMIAGNLIGTTASGTQPLGNGDSGVNLGALATNNLVGGTGQGEGNAIAFNGREGVRVDEDSAGNPILANSIHSNDALGINLEEGPPAPDPVRPNDSGDNDVGANNFQNFPVLTSVISGSGATQFQGSLNSHANRQYRLEFFVNEECDPSGHGEGEEFLGAVNVTTNGAGNVNFTVNGDFGLATDDQVTTTATDLTTGDTSEFSACEPVVAGTPPTPSPTAPGETPTPTPSASPTATPTGTATATPTPTGQTGSPTASPTPTATPPDGTVRWGDNNCSGSADPVDALLELRYDAGLEANTGGCPEMGATVEVGGDAYAWGDVDCNGTVDPVDGLKILRHDAGLSVAQEPGCPEIGAPVLVAQVVALPAWWRRQV